MMKRVVSAAAGAVGVAALGVAAGGASADTPIVLNATAEAMIESFDTSAIGRGKAFVGTTNFGQVRRSLVRFDLSSLPDGEVLTAALGVRITDLAAGGPFDAGAHRLLADWNEGPTLGGGQNGGIPLNATPDDATWSGTGLGGTWANAGGDFEPVPTSVRTMSFVGDTVFFDVTDDVRAFRDGASNYGWILVSMSEGVSQQVVGLSTDAMVFSVDPMTLDVFVQAPSPADLNGDGILDLTDIDLFIVAFGAQDPLADLVEPFGVVDLGDIDAFIAAYLAGTP